MWGKDELQFSQWSFNLMSWPHTRRSRLILQVIPADPLGHLLQGFKFLVAYQLKFTYKVVEMFVACVHMGLLGITKL